MVSLEQGNVEAVKIIDLGLAKTIDEAQSETAITIPGSFAGTPEFASPEQFAGLVVDIRSDLYSLGVTLWAMLTGKPPFHGTPAEVMYRHQLRTVTARPAQKLFHSQPLFYSSLHIGKGPSAAFSKPGRASEGMMPTIATAIADGCTIPTST